MTYNFDKEVYFFMVFDKLGDTVRSGPIQWKISRKRLEDVKNHVTDLTLMARILKKHLPNYLNFDLIYDYIMFHDLPEAITGDITKFQGVSEEEINRVTETAIEFLSKEFNDIVDLNQILNSYEKKIDIESKVVHMLDKLHSATTFIKYQSEQNIDMDNPKIMPELRNLPLVVQKRAEGKDLADIFCEFHFKSINITDEECLKYKISREDADLIVNVIKSFANSFYSKKINKTILVSDEMFPADAQMYKNIDIN